MKVTSRLSAEVIMRSRQQNTMIAGAGIDPLSAGIVGMRSMQAACPAV